MKHIILEHAGQLLLVDSVGRRPDGTISSADVVNGSWHLLVDGCDVLCMNGAHEVTRVVGGATRLVEHSFEYPAGAYNDVLAAFTSVREA